MTSAGVERSTRVNALKAEELGVYSMPYLLNDLVGKGDDDVISGVTDEGIGIHDNLTTNDVSLGIGCNILLGVEIIGWTCPACSILVARTAAANETLRIPILLHILPERDVGYGMFDMIHTQREGAGWRERSVEDRKELSDEKITSSYK